jgi:hypothetical protein
MLETYWQCLDISDNQETEGHENMNDEKISVKITESGQTMDVVVLNKRPDRIQVVVGKGVHSVTCDLTPTRTRQAYAGSVMGREIVLMTCKPN